MSKMKRRSSWHMQALTSTISITMVLVLLGIVTLFTLTVKELSKQVKENLTVTVVLQDDTPTTAAHELESQLKGKPFVHELQYISAEEALKEQTQMLGIDPVEFLGANPFAISMELKMNADYANTDSLLWISEELKRNEIVNDVLYQQDLVENLNYNLKRASLFLLIVAGLLILVSVSLINNTVRLSVYSRRFIIHTMRLVGAKWSFILRPFLVRSMWIGLISATLATVILIGGIHLAIKYDSTVGEVITPAMMLCILVSVFLFGLLISVLCTYLSVTHYLKKRENDLY